MATGAVEVIIVSKIDPSEPALTEPMDDPVAPDFGRISVLNARGPVKIDLAGLVENPHAVASRFVLNFGITEVARLGAARQLAVGSVVAGASRLAWAACLSDCRVGRRWGRPIVAPLVGERVEQVVICALLLWDRTRGSKALRVQSRIGWIETIAIDCRLGQVLLRSRMLRRAAVPPSSEARRRRRRLRPNKPRRSAIVFFSSAAKKIDSTSAGRLMAPFQSPGSLISI